MSSRHSSTLDKTQFQFPQNQSNLREFKRERVDTTGDGSSSDSEDESCQKGPGNSKIVTGPLYIGICYRSDRKETPISSNPRRHQYALDASTSLLSKWTENKWIAVVPQPEHTFYFLDTHSKIWKANHRQGCASYLNHECVSLFIDSLTSDVYSYEQHKWSKVGNIGSQSGGCDDGACNGAIFFSTTQVIR